MEDVIFAGTRERKPLGMASVTMTLVDPQAQSQLIPTVAKTNGGANGINGTNGTNGTTAAHPAAASVERPGEIVVTRRLFRSGESEYLIDGQLARLRDIQDIFMGTGLGPECYAIIEQGRIGQILSSRPQDRRADHRRSRRHHQVQDQAAAGGSQAGRRQAEPDPRVRHPGGSQPAGELAEAAGIQGAPLRGAEGRR